MRRALFALVLALSLAGCGGARPPDEEISASWTSGDDAPLGAPPTGEE